MARGDLESASTDIPASRRGEFEAERAGPMRIRLAIIAVVSLLIWASQFFFYEEHIFGSRQHSLVYRSAQLGIMLCLLAWLWRSRTLASIEWGATAAMSLLNLAHGFALAVVLEPCVVPFTLSLEWGQMVIVLAALFSFRPALGILALTWLVGAVATSYRAAWDIDLSDHVVLLAIYGVVLAHVRSVDRLRRREFATRAHLDVANDDLRRAEQARTRLFVNLSHDFRTPLALIHAEAERLEDEARPERRAAALARVRSNAAALADLTNQLLELARLDTGRAPHDPRPFDVAVLARQTATLFAGTHGGVEVRCTIDGDEPAGALADVGQVRRILSNLIDNAARQVRGGGEVRVVVRARRGAVQLDVADDGPGIFPERRAQVFERFASFDAAGSVASGIGLPVARELAELNGGSLELLDHTPCTTFRVVLPRATGELEALPALGPVPSVDWPDASGPRPVAGRRLLVVEDHPEMRRLLTELLETRFAVETAATVAEAREVLTRLRPTAILCDVLLPDGDGYAVLDHVRRQRELDGVPLLFVSALADAEDRARGLAAGANDYVAKPFSSAELIARVDAAAAQAERRREALERQRADILAELHDGAASAMTRAALLLDIAASSTGSDGEAARAAAGARDTVREALAEVRELLPLLDASACPWDEALADLEGELRRLVGSFDIALDFRTQDDGSVRTLTPAEQYTLRRLASEAAHNAVKHARATRVEVTIAGERGALRLVVEDDGVGLDESKPGRGMSVARRRARRAGGSVRWDRGARGGTRVSARLPVLGPTALAETAPGDYARERAAS